MLMDGETMVTVTDFIFLGSKITVDGDSSQEIKKRLAPWKNSYDKPRQYIKMQRCYFADEIPSSQSCGFSSSHVWMWELDHNVSWTLKNWCFQTVVLGKAHEIPLDCEIKSVHPKVLNNHWQDWCWNWSSNTLATWCEEQTPWKRPCCWERLKAGGDRINRGWIGWMASPTWWTWVWASSGNWWCIGKPDVLQSMRLPRVR